MMTADIHLPNTIVPKDVKAFVSFSIQTDQGMGMGRCFITLSKEPCTQEELEFIENHINDDLRQKTRNKYINVALINWRILKG